MISLSLQEKSENRRSLQCVKQMDWENEEKKEEEEGKDKEEEEEEKEEEEEEEEKSNRSFDRYPSISCYSVARIYTMIHRE
ncbi:hypothetical protein HZH68_013477 [Vespula germanica]|uniref:Uncharacterized protein n=1 Tax=Vespula germanica TaxID=30212 RepID=A0A834MVT6_VESGE|nr:hypothetical protein HZH68_013477 [Vespula germanica]